tara:strand:- start:580 stop:774 length:195 start_codon:yes stop_codon:yes gene_type:complete
VLRERTDPRAEFFRVVRWEILAPEVLASFARHVDKRPWDVAHDNHDVDPVRYVKIQPAVKEKTE